MNVKARPSLLIGSEIKTEAHIDAGRPLVDVRNDCAVMEHSSFHPSSVAEDMGDYIMKSLTCVQELIVS